jgi:hypothetical protein
MASAAGLRRLFDSAPRRPGLSGVDDQVLSVAICARWAVRDPGLKGSTVDGLVVLELNIRMTLPASGGDVDGVDP